MEKVKTRNINKTTNSIAVIIWVALFTVAFIFGSYVLEKKRVIEYNAKLEELCEWIDGYEIVNANAGYVNEHNTSLTYTWTITRLNNGKEETITIKEGPFKRTLFSTCPIYGISRVSPDSKYHIVEDNGRLVIYRPNSYYDTVSGSKYSSK